MKKEELLEVYDQAYAASYNERFLLSPFSKPWADYELGLLKKLIKTDTAWLDMGCGTGYFLSQFAGHERAGMDINPVMLATAKAASPDATFREGDFRNAISEFKDRWSLISCMWGAYIYVDSLQEVEHVVSNMIQWTKPGGVIFLPTIDCDDLRPQTPVTYEEFAFEFGGTIYMNSVTWDWLEADTGKLHKNLVSPHTGHFVKLLQPYFDQIDVVLYPFHPRAGSRKAVIAKNKRVVADTKNPGIVTVHSAPNNIDGKITVKGLATHNGDVAGALSTKQLLGEVKRRVLSGRLFKAVGKKLFSLSIHAY